MSLRSIKRKQALIHIHVQNCRKSPPVFQMTKERCEDALRRHRDVADRVRLTIGSGEDYVIKNWSSSDIRTFEKHMATVNLLIGYQFPTDQLSKRAPCLTTGVNK